MKKHHNFNPDYIHHQKSEFSSVLKEIIFGIEDGMVSTLGSITGIAIGSGNQKTVILAGIVIISVESISMGIGSYLSNKSEEEMDKRKIKEETEEIHKFPEEEKQELYDMYIKNGWETNLAQQMSIFASKNKDLMLKEMSIHELGLTKEETSISLKGGIYMFFSYILGGLIPLFAYFILPINKAYILSIPLTLIGLFVLGIFTTKFTKEPKTKSGFRMFLLGGTALIIGLLAGRIFGI